MPTKYGWKRCRKDPKLKEERDKYFSEILDKVFTTEGCKHIFKYLLSLDYTDFNPENFPGNDEQYEELEKEYPSPPIEFIDTWNWISYRTGKKITEPIKASELMEEWIEWKRRHHSRYKELSVNAFVKEIIVCTTRGTLIVKKNSHINQNLYYSPLIDNIRIEDELYKLDQEEEQEKRESKIKRDAGLISAPDYDILINTITERYNKLRAELY
jgi:hypothetical protein